MFKAAFDALGFTRKADAAAVPDQLVREDDPFVLRDHEGQVLFDFLWVFVAGEVQAIRKALDVGVNDDATGDAVGGSEDDIGGFARNAGELQDFFHRTRDFIAVDLNDCFAGAHDGFGFVAEEAGGANFLFQFGGIGGGEVLRRFVFFEQFLGDFVHANVSALRGEDRGNQQLKRVAVV